MLFRSDVARAEAVLDAEWERVATGWTPRTSLAPLLRSCTTSSLVASPVGAARIDGWIHVGLQAEHDATLPNALRLFVDPDVDPAPIVAAGVAEATRRSQANGGAVRPTLAVARGYERGLRPALEEGGFVPVAAMRLHLRESRRRVPTRGLVPAVG